LAAIRDLQTGNEPGSCSTSDTRSPPKAALASGVGRDSEIFCRHSVNGDEVYP
jgi:hypothetical protein